MGSGDSVPNEPLTILAHVLGWTSSILSDVLLCRIDVKSPPRALGGEGEADSRVGLGGPVPKKPQTTPAQIGGSDVSGAARQACQRS